MAAVLADGAAHRGKKTKNVRKGNLEIYSLISPYLMLKTVLNDYRL